MAHAMLVASNPLAHVQTFSRQSPLTKWCPRPHDVQTSVPVVMQVAPEAPTPLVQLQILRSQASWFKWYPVSQLSHLVPPLEGQADPADPWPLLQRQYAKVVTGIGMNER